MRPRSRCRAWRRRDVFAGWVGLLAVALSSRPARAQTNSGALDLLKPIGARATAMGSAYAAEPGSEAIWWNPAGIARMTKPEFAIDHFENFLVAGGDAVSLILPAGAVGVFGLSARMFNYDTIPSTGLNGEEAGIINPRSIALGATFAASFGERLSAGLSFRVFQFSVSCLGICTDVFATNPYTGFVDVGLQLRPSANGPLQFGVVLSNLGPNLQVRDQAQADALPARLHVGASYQPSSATWDPGLRVKGTAEFVSSLALSAEEVHVGAEAGYLSGSTVLFVRGGAVLQKSTGEGDRGLQPSFGLGLASGRVQVDIARVIESLSTNLGKPPTYLSIRVGL